MGRNFCQRKLGELGKLEKKAAQSSRYGVSLLDVKLGFVPQVKHQNEICKILASTFDSE